MRSSSDLLRRSSALALSLVAAACLGSAEAARGRPPGSGKKQPAVGKLLHLANETVLGSMRMGGKRVDLKPKDAQQRVGDGIRWEEYRGLSLMRDNDSHAFEYTLKALARHSEAGTIVNFGAGQYQLEREMLAEHPEHESKLIGITFEGTHQDLDGNPRFQHFTGRLFDQIGDHELRAAGAHKPGKGGGWLGLDLNGILFYAGAVDKVLTRYLNLAPLGGEFSLVGRQNHTEILIDGKTMSLPDFMRTHVKGWSYDDATHLYVRNADPVHVPELELLMYEKKGTPPHRLYVAKSQKADLQAIGDPLAVKAIDKLISWNELHFFTWFNRDLFDKQGRLTSKPNSELRAELDTIVNAHDTALQAAKTLDPSFQAPLWWQQHAVALEAAGIAIGARKSFSRQAWRLVEGDRSGIGLFLRVWAAHRDGDRAKLAELKKEYLARKQETVVPNGASIFDIRIMLENTEALARRDQYDATSSHLDHQPSMTFDPHADSELASDAGRNAKATLQVLYHLDPKLQKMLRTWW